jgi:DNA-binding CsgD family transcriptional regulator
VAAASLAEADGGLLASARARLTTAGAQPPATAAVLDWVSREAAWLDGQPELAAAAGPTAPITTRTPLVDGLRRITARWAGHDTGTAPAGHDTGTAPAGHDTGTAPADHDTGTGHDTGTAGARGTTAAGGGYPGDAASDADWVAPVARTLAAWAATADPDRFAEAAAAWHDLARREEVRCLLANGLLETEATRAVPPLLRAEQLAGDAGLVVLLGRAQRALRRHAVRRDVRGRRAGDDLTDRERAVLKLVAQGEPTRRIAGQLGISRETVETHIRAGMRKLGARTRTEAAALALEVLA